MKISKDDYRRYAVKHTPLCTASAFIAPKLKTRSISADSTGKSVLNIHKNVTTEMLLMVL